MDQPKARRNTTGKTKNVCVRSVTKRISVQSGTNGAILNLHSHVAIKIRQMKKKKNYELKDLGMVSFKVTKE